MTARPDRARAPEFARNALLSDLLEELNVLLAASGDAVAARHTAPRLPIVMVLGCPRSGTTLVMQWLASLGLFSYPTNLLSRFYSSPYVGALIQRMLADPALQFRNELLQALPSEPVFESSLGKTAGLLSPNEFWFFWRRHFGQRPDPWLPPGPCMDPKRLLAELAALEDGLGRRPLAFKGLMFNWQIPYLDKLFSQVLFLEIRRDPLANMQSLLAARCQFAGDAGHWYSFKPPELDGIDQRDPNRQVAAQVALTRAAVTRGLRGVAPHRCLTIEYEGFCRNPGAVYRQMAQRLEQQAVVMPGKYNGAGSFPRRDATVIADTHRRALLDAYEEYAASAAALT